MQRFKLLFFAIIFLQGLTYNFAQSQALDAEAFNAEASWEGGYGIGSLKGLEVGSSIVEYGKDLKNIFGPTLTADLTFIVETFNPNFDWGVSLSYGRMKVKQDTFTTYFLINDGGTKVIPDIYIVSKADKFAGGFLFSYTFGKMKFRPLVETKLTVDFLSFDEETNNSFERVGIWAFGMEPKIGAVYKLNDTFGIKAKSGLSLFRNNYKVGQRYWSTALGLEINFN